MNGQKVKSRGPLRAFLEAMLIKRYKTTTRFALVKGIDYKDVNRVLDIENCCEPDVCRELAREFGLDYETVYKILEGTQGE